MEIHIDVLYASNASNDEYCISKRTVNKLDGKYSETVHIPAKVFLSPTLGNTCHTYYFAAR